MVSPATLMSRPYALLRRAALPSPSSLQHSVIRPAFSVLPLTFSNKTITAKLFSSIPPASITGDRRHKLSRQGFGLAGRRFTTGATHVNDAGSIDSPLMQSMERKIKEELNADSVIVKDAYGDGRHVSIDVISSAFEGQSAVNRQRMVYKAIWEELQNTVHAVDQMVTKTPAEAAAQK